MLSINPDLSADEVRKIMRQTADKIDDASGDYNEEGWSPQYGFGRVNADGAVREAQRRIDSGGNGKKGYKKR